MRHMHSYSKTEIATEILEAAIAERELHGRHFAAMNLAAVAEEIFGKMARIEGREDQRTHAIDQLMKLQAKLDGMFDFGFDNDRQNLSKMLNSSKNSIKHLNSRSDMNAELFFQVEQESIWQIQGAIRNLEVLDLPIPELVKEFLQTYPPG